MSVFIGYPSFMAYQMMKGKKGNNDGFPSIPGMVARYSGAGLTNEEMSKNPVWKDLTGNGHDLQMKNFAWKGMSGVGGYAGDFSKWRNNRDTTEIGITESNLKVIIDVKVSQGAGKNIVFIKKSDLGISNNVTIKITSTYPEGVMKFANSASNKYLKLPSNGVITLQDNPEYTRSEMYLHLESADLGQITIEQIPEYEGYLVTDGVDDKITSSIFEMGNDWTVIGDWELINTGKNDNAGIVKFDSIVIYNYNYNYNSVLINIKNGRNILIPDQNTVNAICSDGRIYSKDWKESIYNEETESTSKNFLTIGYSGNAYTKIAFKNLAIYPTVLSKDDCIKAYNYLQTLKAK